MGAIRLLAPSSRRWMTSDAVQQFTPEEDAMVKITHDTDEQGRKTGVAVVSFNMPDKMNALTVELGKVFEKKIRLLRSMFNVASLFTTFAPFARRSGSRKKLFLCDSDAFGLLSESCLCRT